MVRVRTASFALVETARIVFSHLLTSSGLGCTAEEDEDETGARSGSTGGRYVDAAAACGLGTARAGT
jgi:hypothetical protein